MRNLKSPSERQIDFAESICEALSLDFPTCSKEFTATSYYKFIDAHAQEFYEATSYQVIEDDLIDYVVNDVWTEHY